MVEFNNHFYSVLNLKIVTSYNLQSNGQAVCLASELLLSTSVALTTPNKKRSEMCGRSRTLRADDIARACHYSNHGNGPPLLTFNVDQLVSVFLSSTFAAFLLYMLLNDTEYSITFRYHPSYNVSPGHNLPVVHREQGSASAAASDADDDGVVHCMKWGLIPTFTKKIRQT